MVCTSTYPNDKSESDPDYLISESNKKGILSRKILKQIFKQQARTVQGSDNICLFLIRRGRSDVRSVRRLRLPRGPRAQRPQHRVSCLATYSMCLGPDILCVHFFYHLNPAFKNANQKIIYYILSFKYFET